MNFFTTFVADNLPGIIMNILDIILLLVLAAAGISGYRKGLISQAFGIGGLLLGIWLGYRFSARLAGWFDMSDSYANLLAFIVILILAIIAAFLVGKAVRSVFRMTGFGILDRIGGLALGVLKIALIVCLLLGLFVNFNKDAKIVNPKIVDGSLVYKPLRSLGDAVFPWILESTSRLFESGRERSGTDQPKTI